MRNDRPVRPEVRGHGSTAEVLRKQEYGSVSASRTPSKHSVGDESAKGKEMFKDMNEPLRLDYSAHTTLIIQEL